MFVNTVTHYDFAEATKCSFLKIIVDRRGFGKSTILPNIHLITLSSISFIYLLGSFYTELNPGQEACI